MKKLLLLASFLFTCSIAPAQQGGWRENEMEIKVMIPTKADADALQALHLNGEIYLNYALMDVIPPELEKIKSNGLKYEVMISDLNEYYKDFWVKKNGNTIRADKYHTYDEIISIVDSLAAAFPETCKKFSFGTSVQGRQLCCLKISDHVETDENEPEVLIDGGIHGDEIGGAENTIRFARHLCLNYNKNTEITTLINNREIWIYPMVNPDGRVNMTRSNSNQIDLNRDFGYMWNGEGSSKSSYSQVETKAIRDCIYANQFAIHLSCHSGSENVFFPWCHRAAHAPDYSNFNKLAGNYASTSGYSSLVYTQSNADYATTGELDDCSYGVNGSMGMVLEISSNKQPSETEMVNYYHYNVPAMVNLLNNAGYGAEGVVTDSITGNPIAAALFVDGSYPIYTDPQVGDYHKYLLPGTHSIKVVANGYAPKTISQITVVDKKSTVTNIQLKPLKGQYIYRVACAVIPGNNPADEGNTPAVIGSSDQVSYSIGKGGTIIVDMQRPIKDVQGKDLKVFEGDSSPEGFTLYAGQTQDGPWKSLGTGKGTSDFDLSQSGFQSAQFIKIVDDNDGTANANDAGFDLDAIQALDSIATGISESTENLNFVAYPNPFTNTITFEYSSTSTGAMYLYLYNSLGQQVLVLTANESSIGKHVLQVNASSLIPGLYHCRLQKENNVTMTSTYILKL